MPTIHLVFLALAAVLAIIAAFDVPYATKFLAVAVLLLSVALLMPAAGVG